MAKYKLTTYLAGPMEHVGIQEASSWRDQLTPKLNEMLIKVLDPCKTEAIKTGFELQISKEKVYGAKRSGHWESFDLWMDAIIYGDLIDVHRSDFILAYLDF